MAWIDNLRPASFRNIRFFIDTSQFNTGRRLAFHEYPDRDEPFAEDLGRVGRTFKVEGHILGDEYFETKRQLIEACEKEGPGELIHPYYGTRQVVCGPFSIDEDTKEGGIAKVSFQFYEAGDNRFPKEIEDKVQKLAEVSATATAASTNKFANKFNVIKLAGYAVNTARASVEQAAQFYENATKDLTAAAEGLADLAFSIRNLRAEVNDLLQSPAKLAQRLLDSFELLEAALSLPAGKYRAVLNFVTLTTPFTAGPVETPTRLREADNANVFDSFMHEAAVAQAVNIVPLLELSSLDDAIKIRQELRDQIEIILNTTDDDDVFVAFKDLNAQLSRVLPDADSDLPNVQKYTPPQVVNSLALTYDLFENLDSEADLIERNNIQNPAFIQAGVELEVIDVRASS